MAEFAGYNTKMNNKIDKIILIPLILIIFSINVNAIGLGVSPSQLVFSNVLKGGYSQNNVYLSTDTTQNLSMFFEVDGDIKNWLRVENNLSYVTVSRNSPRLIKVIIEPPLDTANGNYSGALRIITDKLVDPETGIGSSVKAAFMVNIAVEVTGTEIRQCSGGGISVSDIEKGYPLSITSSIKNEGNVRITPQIFVNVWDKYQTQIVYSGVLQSDSILPTDTIDMIKELTTNLNEDQYWAEIKIPECNSGNTQTFNVVEKGGISDKGELIRIENKPWALVDEIIPITGVFRNDGQRTVSAKLKGEILFNNKVVKIIDTDSIDAAPGEIVSLQTFFRPTDAGQYFVNGKVYFNNKLTTQKASVINVNFAEVTATSKNNMYVWYALIIIIIGILVMIILIKRKKSKHRKF